MSDKFHQRSTQAELLDSPEVPEHLLLKNLRELDMLNRSSGGHQVSLDGLKMLMVDRQRTYHIVDIGCGSGDLLRVIARRAAETGYRVKLTGVDKHQGAIRYLEEKSAGYPQVSGVVADYRPYLKKIADADIMISSLFFHHLTDKEVVWLLKMMYEKAAVGFVVNDLLRNRWAYYGAAIITRVLGGTSLSRHDGPVSVLRGFRISELHTYFQEAGIQHYTIQRKPLFRFLAAAGKSFRNTQ